MRVLIVEPDGFAGNWHYATALAGGFSEVGIPAALATMFPYERVPGVIEAPTYSIGQRQSSRTRSVRVIGSGVRVVNHFDKLLKLQRIVRQFGPDVVNLHGSLGKLDALYYRYLRSLGVSLAYTAYDLGASERVLGRAEFTRYRSADLLFVHSSDDAARLLRLGIDARKVWKIPHGNFLHLCGQPLPRTIARQQIGLPTDARALLFFGKLEPRKGLDILLAAFARLAPGRPDLWLVIAGPASEGFRTYARMIDRLGLAGRVVTDVRYVPFDEIAQYFCAVDAVILPYRRIQGSGVLQLAYGFARPIVVSDVGGIAEVVREDRTGIVAQTVTEESFAAAIADLLERPASAEQMGQRARTLAETKYAWRSVAIQVAEACHQTMSNRRVGSSSG